MEMPTLRVLLSEEQHQRLVEEISSTLINELRALIRQIGRKEYLTRHELASLTGWSVRQIDYMRTRGQLSFIKRGRLVLFSADEIDEWLREGRVSGRKTRGRAQAR